MPYKEIILLHTHESIELLVASKLLVKHTIDFIVLRDGSAASLFHRIVKVNVLYIGHDLMTKHFHFKEKKSGKRISQDINELIYT